MPLPPAPYPSDLTDDEWEVIAPLFSKSEKRGKKPVYDLRRVLEFRAFNLTHILHV